MVFVIVLFKFFFFFFGFFFQIGAYINNYAVCQRFQNISKSTKFNVICALNVKLFPTCSIKHFAVLYVTFLLFFYRLYKVHLGQTWKCYTTRDSNIVVITSIDKNYSPKNDVYYI